MFGEFSYFTPRAYFVLVIHFIVNGCYSCIADMEIYIKDHRSTFEWVTTDLLLPLMLAAIFAWVGDCHTERYFIAILYMVCPLIYVPMFHLARALGWRVLFSGIFFNLGNLSLTVYEASKGIFYSVMMDQIDMDAIPDNEGILRKFIFYIYLCYYCGRVTPMLLFNWFKLSFRAVIAVTSTFYVLHLICTLMVIVGFFGIYITPSDKHVLPTCIAITLKHNFKLFMIDGPDLTEEIMVTIKLLMLLGTVTWMSLAHAIGELFEHSIVDSMDAADNILLFFTVTFFLTICIAIVLELVMQPCLRNETPLKTPFHYIAIAIFISVAAMVLRGLFLQAREIENISQPRVRGHCQLRFFNSLGEKVSVRGGIIFEVNIKPYGAAYLLKIPVKSRLTILVTTSQISFNEDLNLFELFSYSYVVHSDRVTEELVQNPIMDNWQLRSDTSYFFILDNKISNVLTFYKEGKISVIYSISKRSTIYAIHPGIYTVHIETNVGEIGTDSKMLMPGHVYCLFIYSLQNDSSAIRAKFFFNTLKNDENYYAEALQGLMFSIGQMLLFVSILFYIQTESSVSSRGTVFTWTMILFHLAHKLMLVKKMIFRKVTTITFYTTAFFLVAFIIAALNSALRYQYTKYSLK